MKPPSSAGTEHALTNLLVDALPDTGRRMVLATAEHVRIRVNQLLCEVGQPIEFAYFPLDCLISATTALEEGGIVGAVAIGREGVSGFPLIFGVGEASMREVGEVAGDALRVPAAVFFDLQATYPAFRVYLARYADAVVKLLAQTLACNRFHNVEKRCARWLLMTQDRVGSDRLALTHELLAQMLGTYRPTVSLALQQLEAAGLVRPERRAVIILSREGLEAVSCECYRAVQERFEGYYRVLTGER